MVLKILIHINLFRYFNVRRQRMKSGLSALINKEYNLRQKLEPPNVQ
jgi:hypothetical protein